MTDAGASGTAPASSTFCPRERRKFVLIAAILASAMGFIDGSVVSIAMPAIRADLGASLAAGQWISNSYMLFLSSLILIGGAAGDSYGLRRVFAAGIALFSVASLVCALAPDAPYLIGARAVQGIGAAVMVPGSLAIIAKAYPSGERGKAIGIWAAAASITTAAGPLIGGVVLSTFGEWSWRLIFAINLPLGALALGLLWLRVPADVVEERRPLDLAGGLLATVGLFLIAFGLTGSGEEGSIPDGARMALFSSAGLLVLAGFVVWESRARHPMMPLRLFANIGFSGANGLTFFLYFALAAVQFYLPMAVISGWGVSEVQIALTFLPISVMLGLLSGPSGALADRIGPAPLVTGGALLVAAAYAGLAIAMPFENFWFGVFPMMLVMGGGLGLLVSPLSTAVMTSVEDADTGTASGVNNAVARMAGFMAVAAMGGVAAFAFQLGLAGSAAEGIGLSFGLAPDGALLEAADIARRAATNFAFSAVAWITAGLAALSAGVAWFTLAHKWRAAKAPA